MENPREKDLSMFRAIQARNELRYFNQLTPFTIRRQGRQAAQAGYIRSIQNIN